MSSRVSALAAVTALVPGTLAYVVPSGDPIGKKFDWGNFSGQLGINLPDFQYNGVLDFGKYLVAQGVAVPVSAVSTTAMTGYLQNFLLYAQQKFLVTMKASNQSLDNLDAWSCIRAKVNIGSNISLNCPIIVPRYVALDAEGQRFVRVGNAGSITSFYNGDTTTQACANVYQPLFQFAPGSHNVGRLIVICNSVGTDRGSAGCAGRTWSFKSVAGISAAGNGWNVGDTFTINLGDVKYPYATATATVASLTGAAGSGVATITFAPARWTTTGGIMGLPPALQVVQWGAAGTGVLDPSSAGSTPVYLTTAVGPSTGTGLKLTMNFWQDWETANTSFHGLFSNYNSYEQYLGRVEYAQSTFTSAVSGTYGPIFGFLIAAYETQFESIQGQGSDIGLEVTGSDCRGGWYNPVNAGVGLKLFAGSSFSCSNVIIDTPILKYIDIDKFGLAIIRGACFNNGSSTALTPYAIGISQNDTSGCSNLNLDITMYNGGASTPIPAMRGGYCYDSHFNLTVANINGAGGAYALQNSAFMNVTTGWDNSNIVTGSIDNISGAILTGTMPTSPAGFMVWDGNKGKWTTSANAFVYNGQRRTITSGASDTATTNDKTVIWNSSTSSAKAHTIPGATTANDGFELTIKDAKGDAWTNNITVTPSSGTIEGQLNYVITAPFAALTLRCDGSSTNYVIV